MAVFAFILKVSPRHRDQKRTWFDPKREIDARFIYLGSQKVENGILPLRTILPAEDWVLVVDIQQSELRGYVVVEVQNCAISLKVKLYGVNSKNITDGRIILIAKPGNRLIQSDIDLAILNHSIINMNANDCSHHHN